MTIKKVLMNNLSFFWIAILIELPLHETNSAFKSGYFGIFENQSVVDWFDQILFHFEIYLQIVKQSLFRIQTRRWFGGIGSIQTLWLQRLCFFMFGGLFATTVGFASFAFLHAFFLAFDKRFQLIQFVTCVNNSLNWII